MQPTDEPAEGSLGGQPLDEWLTVTEYARALRFSEGHVYRLLKAEQVRGAVRIGGSWRINRAEWLAAPSTDNNSATPADGTAEVAKETETR